MDKEAIKQLLNSKAWGFIEQMLLEEANKVKKIRVAGVDYQTIAVEAIANEKVSKSIANLLNRLTRIKNDGKETKPVYR